MCSASVSSKSNDLTNSEDSTESNILVKFRKLKLDENFISRNYSVSECYAEENSGNLFSEAKQLSKKLKNCYIDIRDLFEEVKVNTNSKDNFQSLDIDNMKKDILNLETKIQNLKTSLHNQLRYLKSTEQDLMREVDESPIDGNKQKFKQVKIKSYTEIVPSPVKNLIDSPFKCPEVQEFQNFMAHSKNKYGGWVPYNHHVFVKIWEKYFYTQNNIEDLEYKDVNTKNSKKNQLFLYDVCRKIIGIKLEDVLSHSQWYTKYIYLKKRQQRAIEKWRIKRKLIKISRRKLKQFEKKHKENLIDNTSTEESSEKDLNVSDEHNLKKSAKVIERKISKKQEETEKHNFMFETLTDSFTPRKTLNESIDEVSNSFERKCITLTRTSLSSYRNPTVQWNLRCNSVNIEKECYKHRIDDVENMQKRRIPDWRQVLHTE